MNSFLKALVFAWIVLSTFSCTKQNSNPEELPAATTTGANKLGYKVDGKNYVPVDGRGREGLSVEYVYTSWTAAPKWLLIINAKNESISTGEILQIAGDSVSIQQGKTYRLVQDRNDGAAPGGFVFALVMGNKRYTNTANSGSVTITRFDQSARIIAGTFEGTVQADDGSRKSITDGRFDLKY